MRVLGIEPRSSCLHCKNSINQAFSLVSLYFYKEKKIGGRYIQLIVE